MSRRGDLLVAFRRAGARGLTTREMKEYAGPRGVQLFGQLMDRGFRFRSDRSRFGNREPWRWQLVYEPPAEPVEPEPPAAPEPEQSALFDPPTPSASSLAVFGDPQH